MELVVIEKQVNKIAKLLETCKLDHIISEIERDLLLSYTIKLYESIKYGEKNAGMDKIPRTTDHTTPISPKEEAKEAIIMQVPVNVEAQARIVDEQIKEVATAPAPKVGVEIKTNEIQFNSRYEELFEVEDNADLSAKLAMSKINDISKAMGINEIFFTVNELFKGDRSTFDQTIQRLNNAGNFDEARAYLEQNVIEKFEWADDSKIKKAQTFIKLVRRLFV